MSDQKSHFEWVQVKASSLVDFVEHRLAMHQDFTLTREKNKMIKAGN